VTQKKRGKKQEEERKNSFQGRGVRKGENTGGRVFERSKHGRGGYSQNEDKSIQERMRKKKQLQKEVSGKKVSGRPAWEVRTN